MVAHKLVTPIPLPEPSAIRIPCTPAEAVEFCVGRVARGRVVLPGSAPVAAGERLVVVLCLPRSETLRLAARVVATSTGPDRFVLAFDVMSPEQLRYVVRLRDRLESPAASPGLDWEAAITVARMRLERGEVEEAGRLYELAAEAGAPERAVRFGREMVAGIRHAQAGALGFAVAHLQRACTLEPDDSRARARLRAAERARRPSA